MYPVKQPLQDTHPHTPLSKNTTAVHHHVYTRELIRKVEYIILNWVLEAIVNQKLIYTFKVILQHTDNRTPIFATWTPSVLRIGLGKRHRVLENKLLYTQNLTRICVEALHGNKMMEVQRYIFSVLICESHCYSGLSLGSGGRGTCGLKSWSNKDKRQQKTCTPVPVGVEGCGVTLYHILIEFLALSFIKTCTQFCTYWESHHHRTGLRTSQQPDKVGTFHSLQALCPTGSKHKKVQKNAYLFLLLISSHSVSDFPPYDSQFINVIYLSAHFVISVFPLTAFQGWQYNKYNWQRNDVFHHLIISVLSVVAFYTHLISSEMGLPVHWTANPVCWISINTKLQLDINQHKWQVGSS